MAVFMSVAKDYIRKATDRVNYSMEFWGCTNSPIYHYDRLHTYKNFPQNMESNVADRAKQSIQEYDKLTSMMGGIRRFQDIQEQWVHTSPTAVLSMFEEHTVPITQYWKEEGFGYLDQSVIMCEIMYPYKSRSVQVACERDTRGKYKR